MALREMILSASTRRSNVNAAAGMMVGKRDKASAASIKPISLHRQCKAPDALAINWQTGKSGNSSRVWLVSGWVKVFWDGEAMLMRDLWGIG